LFINKLHENRPNISDAIVDGHIDLVINTPAGRLSEYDDSYIRKSAIRHNIPYITTTAAAYAAAEGIRERLNGSYKVKSLQDYHRDIGHYTAFK
jgi:carbamoyl-phosphate synthase large subunit